MEPQPSLTHHAEGLAGPLHAPEVTANTQGVQVDPEPPFTRLQAFNVLIEESKKINGRLGRPTDLSKPERLSLMSLALAKQLHSPLSNDQEKTFATAIALFICKTEQKFKACKSNFSYFEKKNKDWLNKAFIHDLPEDLIRSAHVDFLPQNCTQSALNFEEEQQTTHTVSAFSFEDCVQTPSTTFHPHSVDSSNKTYEDLNPRQKQRAIKRLQAKLEEEPPEKLIKTFTKTITVGGEKLSKKSARDLETIINKCTETPDKPTKILSKLNEETLPYTPEEALGIIIDRRFSVETYKFLQQNAKKRGVSLYPPYHQVAQARQSCYPSENISVSHIEASVTLQGLLTHTLQRILDLNDETINQYMEKENINQLSCTFYASWGFDASSGQSVYKQGYSDHPGDHPDFDEKSIVATTLVPLKIQECGGKKSSIWLNPAPQSFRSCRPLHIQYRKETKQLILSEKEYVEEQIRTMTPITTLTSKGFIVFTNCHLTLSIIDGKVYSIINNTSSHMRCPICKLTSTNFNNLDLAFSVPITEEEALKNGMSPLHAYIRCLEFLLHLGYKNDPRVRQWRVLKKSDVGQITAERKTEIQNQIKEKMNLLVDVVKPNSGTTNDGNTARRVFKSEQSRQTFANILGIEKWLVDDLNVILIAINSGLPIDAQKFSSFCKNLAQKYVKTYNWHPMSTTIHKILIHGKKIMENSVLPIGLLSEQAGESRNKFWRQDREHHSRKDSRVHTMTDLFHRALESSDPAISAARLKYRQNNRMRMPLPEAVKEMLQPDNVDCFNEDNNDVDEEISCTESEENEFTTVLHNEDSLFSTDDV